MTGDQITGLRVMGLDGRDCTKSCWVGVWRVWMARVTVAFCGDETGNV